MLDDETLRDGLQSPSVRTPTIDAEDPHPASHRLRSASTPPTSACRARARTSSRTSSGWRARSSTRSCGCAPTAPRGRSLADILPIVEIAQRTGLAIECCTFIGSSPIRQYAEDWTLDKLQRLTDEAVAFARRSEGLPVMYVTEDTTRADPESLRALYSTAIRAGATRVCIADTVGHATPAGARAVVRFVQSIVDECGGGVGIDWHGHRDRDLAVENSLAAMEAGATRLHGAAIGIGERVGNTPMDVLLVNLVLMGMPRGRSDAAGRVLRGRVARRAACRFRANYPVVGRDAFRTATGVHAAAVIKAFKKHDAALADAVYSGVPASLVGREQIIEIGPMSGRSNVVYWLEQRGLEATDERVDRIFAKAKAATTVLTEEEIVAAEVEDSRVIGRVA